MERNVDGLASVVSDPRYLAFIAHFNGDRDYFECHEVMEELWLEEGRSPLLQGLLQAAVGLYHWDNSNLSGAVKLMSSALSKLDHYGDYVLGLDLFTLRHDLQLSLEAIMTKPENAPFQAFMLKIDNESLSVAVKEWESQSTHPEDEAKLT
jgi:uncharacterized protein